LEFVPVLSSSHFKIKNAWSNHILRQILNQQKPFRPRSPTILLHYRWIKFLLTSFSPFNFITPLCPILSCLCVCWHNTLCRLRCRDSFGRLRLFLVHLEHLVFVVCIGRVFI